MARRRQTSRVTAPGTRPADGTRPPTTPAELPSIRKRRPGLFWTVVLASFAMLVPLVLGFFQAIS